MKITRPKASAQLDLDLSAPAPAPASPAPAASSGHELPPPRIWTVSALTRSIRETLENGVGSVWVEGEISNLRTQPSGIRYFTLKDPGASLRCVLFPRGTAAGPVSSLRDGLQIEAFGLITVYEPQGQYQLQVRKFRAKGAGALAARFEALKRRLEAEGLFDPARKRPLPKFPARVGVVTSPAGAAIRDFLHVLHRRHPGIAVLINPVRVQGAGAAAEIAAAIRQLAEPQKFGLPPVDVIVVTRGGGSLEDLWEFNEESVARAVAASPIPVVSAVGHEIDFTICDFAADLRAPTPSAAAEILSADAARLRAQLAREAARIRTIAVSALEAAWRRLQAGLASPLFREPGRRILELTQHLDRLIETLQRGAASACERRRASLEKHAARLHPAQLRLRLSAISSRLEGLDGKLHALARPQVEARRATLERLEAQLASLNPAAVLARGYTLTFDTSGKLLRSASAARAAGTLRTRFHNGEIISVVPPENPAENEM